MRIGIRIKNLVAIFIIVCIAILSVSYLAITNSYDSLRNEIGSSNLIIAKSSSEYLRQYIAFNMDIVHFRATHPDVIKAVENWDLNILNIQLARMMRESPESLGFLILDRDGILRNCYPYMEEEIGKNYSHKPYFQDVVKKDDFSIDKSYINQDSNTPVLPIAYPIKSSNGTTIGVLVSLINISRTFESFEGIKMEKVLYVVNNYGEIIYHPNFEYIRNRLNLSSYAPVQEVIAGREGIGEYDSTGENRELVAYTPLRAFGWGVVVTQPIAIAYAPAYKLLNNIILVTAVVLGIAFIITLVTTNRMTKSILELTTAAKQIANGNYLYKVKIESRDEIGELARAFNQMANDLQYKESRLKKYSEELEEKVKLRTKELQERTKELESFIYFLSHDLKNPLISIDGYTNILLKEYKDKLGEDGRFYLERISSNIETMEMLITDLLEFSRIGRISQPREDINTAELVKEICEEFKQRNKRVQFIIQDGLPNIYGEKMRIAQVFTNLIDNAIKYMGNQTQPIIEIGYGDLQNKWQFYVKDNGMGIAEEQQGKLFQPFQRIIDERTKNIKGTGLGLSIVKKIVELHNGEVGVESKVGVGSKFYFTIPKRGI